MTTQKFQDVQAACAKYAEMTEKGSRIAKEKEYKLLIDWVKKECSERKKNSKYFVYTYTVNLGNKKYPYILTACSYYTIDRWKETEKCYVSECGSRVLKEKIIGWLS